MRETINSPIVGAKFRPPAQGILSVLGVDTPLLVRREPDNPFDFNALQVLVAQEELAKLPHAQLLTAVSGYGFGVSEYGELSDPSTGSVLPGPIHLGYVPRSEALTLAPRFDVAGQSEVAARLTFSVTGGPQVSFEVP